MSVVSNVSAAKVEVSAIDFLSKRPGLIAFLDNLARSGCFNPEVTKIFQKCHDHILSDFQDKKLPRRVKIGNWLSMVVAEAKGQVTLTYEEYEDMRRCPFHQEMLHGLKTNKPIKVVLAAMMAHRYLFRNDDDMHKTTCRLIDELEAWDTDTESTGVTMIGLIKERPYLHVFFDSVERLTSNEERHQILRQCLQDLYRMELILTSNCATTSVDWLRFLCQEITNGQVAAEPEYFEISKEVFHQRMHKALVNNQPILAALAYIDSFPYFFRMDPSSTRKIGEMRAALLPWAEAPEIVIVNIVDILEKEPFFSYFLDTITSPPTSTILFNDSFADRDACLAYLKKCGNRIFEMREKWRVRGQIFQSGWIERLCDDVKTGKHVENIYYNRIKCQPFHSEIFKALKKNQPIRAIAGFIDSYKYFYSMSSSDQDELDRLSYGLGAWIEVLKPTFGSKYVPPADGSGEYADAEGDDAESDSESDAESDDEGGSDAESNKNGFCQEYYLETMNKIADVACDQIDSDFHTVLRQLMAIGEEPIKDCHPALWPAYHKVLNFLLDTFCQTVYVVERTKILRMMKTYFKNFQWDAAGDIPSGGNLAHSELADYIASKIKSLEVNFHKAFARFLRFHVPSKDETIVTPIHKMRSKILKGLADNAVKTGDTRYFKAMTIYFNV